MKISFLALHVWKLVEQQSLNTIRFILYPGLLCRNSDRTIRTKVKSIIAKNLLTNEPEQHLRKKHYIWLSKFYAIFTSLGQRASGFWYRLLNTCSMEIKLTTTTTMTAQTKNNMTANFYGRIKINPTCIFVLFLTNSYILLTT